MTATRSLDPMEAPREVPLYLHIPKCGGSTITHVIYQQCFSATRDARRSKYWHKGVYFYPAGLFSQPSAPSNPEVAQMLKRADLRAVVGHFSFGIHRYVSQPSRYITVLRNPATRMLSLYDELTAQKRIDTAFEQFIFAPPFPGLENDQTRRVAGFQTGKDDEGELMLETAKKNIETHFAVVGVTEQMDETLYWMHRRFGWNEHCVYYPKNVTLKRTNRDSISPDLLQVIEDRNSLDFRLYRFAEKLLHNAIAQGGPEFQSGLKQYKESIKNFVEQTDVDSIKNLEGRKVHQLVLAMINQGNSRKNQ